MPKHLTEAAGAAVSSQADFVALAQRRSPYKRMTVKKVSFASENDALEVICHADDAGAHKLSYIITGSARYRLVAEVKEYGPEYASSMFPPPTQNITTDYGVPDVRIGEITLTGTWNTSSTYYTTAVNDTWTAPITVTTANSKLYFTVYTDNRGGLWKLDLVEAPAVTANISMYAAVAGYKYNTEMFTIPAPGSYTLRGTFLGDDPANLPSGGAGTSRGWLHPAASNNYVARVSAPVQGFAILSPGVSNKNWAFRVKHPTLGVDEFIPYHGTNVETIVDAPVFYDGLKLLDFSTLALDQSMDVGSLTMIQHIKGHTSGASGTELVEAWTQDTILPNGTYRAEGAIKTLNPLLTMDSMYTGMLPVNPEVLNSVTTSYRNTYPATVAMGNGSSTFLPAAEGLLLQSVAVVGPDAGHLAAVRFNDRKATRRLEQSTVASPAFIEHRNATLTKFYPRFGYVDNVSVPAGTVWRFDAEYWFGRIPGVKPMIAV